MLEDLAPAVLDAIALAQQQIADERRQHAAAMAAARAECAAELAAARGERDEARRQLADLTVKLLEAKVRTETAMVSAPFTFGERTCPGCGNPFHKKFPRQSKCDQCKSDAAKRAYDQRVKAGTAPHLASR